MNGSSNVTAKPADELLPRHLKEHLVAALASARVVNIVGPRQVGKTTLVRDLLGQGRFVTLDDEGVHAAIERDPLGQLHFLTKEAGDAPLIIDEAQRSRRLALAIKAIVDERRRMGQFILTGSSNIFTTVHVADSLAGRVQTPTMYPMSTAETHGASPALVLDWAVGRMDGPAGPTLASLPIPQAVTREGYLDLIVRGGYPEIRTLPIRARIQRHRSYIETIVDRDVADLLRIRKTDAMRRLIDQIAVRTGLELNVRELCGLVGLKHPTVDQYLDILTRLALITRLGSWTSGEARREVRHPKIHVIDTGIVAALRNFTTATFGPEDNPTALGGLLESFVHAEILKNLPYQQDDWRLYHWRAERDREVDILAEAGRNIVVFEVKAAATVGDGDFRHLRWFRNEGPGRNWNVTGIVVYLGERPLAFSDRMFALPLSTFWAFGPDGSQKAKPKADGTAKRSLEPSRKRAVRKASHT